MPTPRAHGHGRPPERHFVREVRSTIFWGLVLPALALALAWPTRGVSLALLAGYLVLFWRDRTLLSIGRGWPAADARLYAGSCVLAKFPTHGAWSSTGRRFTRHAGPDHRIPSGSRPPARNSASASTMARTDRRLAVGFLGAGYIADWHAAALRTVRAPAGGRLRPGRGPRPSLARGTASPASTPRWARCSPGPARRHPRAAPPRLHAQAAGEIIDAGVHVLLEKPMAVPPRSARLIERARAGSQGRRRP